MELDVSSIRSGESIRLLSIVGFGLLMPLGRRKSLMLFFLLVTLSTGKVCECEITIKPFDLRNTFDTVE